MTNPTIQTDIAEILKDLQDGQKVLIEKLNKLEIGQAEIKGEIKALDTKVEQLDKRVANQEFLNRGVFVGLLLAPLSGVINFFGWIPKA
jgi:hypothetical protein